MSKQKKRSVIKWIVGIVIVAVVVIGGVVSERGSAIPVQTATVTKGRIQSYVEERARTTLPHVYHLTMPEQGRVHPITLEAGAPVKKDQVVVTLDAADLQDALKEANEMVSAMANAVDASQSKITATKAGMEYAKWLWDAKKQLYTAQQTSEMDEKDAQRTYVESQVDFEESQSIFYAMSALNAAVKLMPIYVNRRLNRATLTSPVDGVVLKRYVWNERVMQPGEALLDIGNLNDLEVTADILSEEVVAVKKGQQVEIYGETIGATPIRGTVTRVKPQGFTKISSLGVEQQRVSVIIKFDEKDMAALAADGRTLGLEYRVRVRIFTDEKDHALTVPRTALFRNNKGGWAAYVVRDGKAQLVTVGVGLTNDTQAEILDGLQAGEVVIMAPEASLTSGTRVNADNS
ncbi:MAG: efflux RND transporter periplasmic adaptor subunit [Spartobacteria bacterium]|nr:efflux RND transporter periplasmic adaptor subunit [Spartobacteria bacterium]